MKVSELMTPNAITVTPDMTMGEAVKSMAEHDIGCLPVIDGNQQVVGIVTDRDIVLAAANRDLPLSQLPIAEAMTKEVAAVSPATAIEQAERLLRERQLHRLPVIDENRRAIGMISLNDIARAAETKRWQGDDALSPQEVSRTVAAIAEPRGEAPPPPSS